MTEDQMARHARLCPLCRAEVTRPKLFRASTFFNPEKEAAADEEDEEDEERDELDEDVKPMAGSSKRPVSLMAVG